VSAVTHLSAANHPRRAVDTISFTARDCDGRITHRTGEYSRLWEREHAGSRESDSAVGRGCRLQSHFLRQQHCCFLVASVLMFTSTVPPLLAATAAGPAVPAASCCFCLFLR
jgi:hypothetical protein